MQLLDRGHTALLIVCALLAIGCWAESVRQLHRSARPAEHDVLPSGLQSGSWLLTFSGEAHAQGLDLALGGLVIPERAFWIPASSSLSPPRRLVARWSNVSVLGQGRNRLRLRSWARRVTRGPLHRVTADGNGASSSNPRAPWPPLESITGQTASSSCARTIDPCANLDAYCIEFGPRQARGAIRTILYKESISFDWDPTQLALSAARLIDEKACRLLNKHRINQD